MFVNLKMHPLRLRVPLLLLQARNLKFTRRHLSYVEKCKYLQNLKSDELEVLQLIPQAKFIVYSGSKPLIEAKSRFSKNFFHQLKWLKFSDLVDHKRFLISGSVLIDVDSDKTPIFGVQIGHLNDSEKNVLETNVEGEFVDLRAALFMMNWGDAQLLSRANALLMFHKINQFCGSCGKKTKRNGAGSSRSCPECGNGFYPQSQPVGIVLVTDPSKEFAVLVRQSRHPQGMFSCIAGFADAGEDLETAVKREVAEEVGLEVREVSYAASQHWPFPGSLMVGCYAVADREELNIDTCELETGRWFSREEIRDALKRINANPSAIFRARRPKETRSVPDSKNTLNLENSTSESEESRLASYNKAHTGPITKSVDASSISTTNTSVSSNTSSSLSTETELWVPPSGAIAHHLILHWLKKTPLQDIRKCILNR